MYAVSAGNMGDNQVWLLFIQIQVSADMLTLAGNNEIFDL